MYVNKTNKKEIYLKERFAHLLYDTSIFEPVTQKVEHKSFKTKKRGKPYIIS